MEHKELIEVLQKEWQKNKKECESLLKTLLQLIGDTTTMMHGVAITNFGTFMPVKTLERISVDTDTHTRMLLPPEIRLTYSTTPSTESNEQSISESDLATLLAKRTAIAHEEAIAIVTSLFNLIAQTCDKGESVVIHNLGVFSSQWIAESERYEREFAPDKQMREWVNAPFASFMPEPIAEQVEEDIPAEEEKEEIKVEEEIAPTIEETEETEERETETPTTPEPTITPTTKEKKSNWGFIATVILLIAAIAVGGYYLYIKTIATKKQPITAVVATPEISKPIAIEEPEPVAIIAEPEVVDTIRKGVFMTTLSLKHYGNKAFWVYIYEENKARITNPNAVPPNTPVIIPPKSKYNIDATSTTALEIALKRADEITKTL